MNKPEAGSIGLVERAKALAPLIAAEADEIEQTRRLTPKVVSAWRKSPRPTPPQRGAWVNVLWLA
jgi:hypothetical protein